MRSHKKNLIIVFDLDQTIGYFTQFAIFMEGIESYIKRKLKRDEFYKLLDLYPKIFRPKMMDLFKYLEKLKRSNKWLKIMAKDLEIDKKITCHVARHTFGNLSGDKIPIQMLQKLYRHSSITTTVNYQQAFMNKETDDALDKVLNGDD